MLIKSLYFCDMNGSWKKKMTKITTDNKLCILKTLEEKSISMWFTLVKLTNLISVIYNMILKTNRVPNFQYLILWLHKQIINCGILKHMKGKNFSFCFYGEKINFCDKTSCLEYFC